MTIRAQLNAGYEQAGEFLRVYSDQLTVEQKVFLSEYASIPNYGKLKRWMISQKLSTLKRGLIRRVAQFLYI